MMGDLSRRRFLGIGAASVALATAGLAGCAPASSQDDSAASGFDGSWTKEVDVVVVGGGAAGHAAAIEAARAGAKTLILEKADMAGGDAALCQGILGGWGTRLAKEQGIDLTADDVYDWFVAHPDWYGALDPELARINADKCGETVDWLEDQGVPFLPEVAPKFGYTDLPAIHLVDGGGGKMMQVLIDVAAQEGVETLLGTRAVSLVSDESGRIIGVEARDGKEPLFFKANKGVVLASGGFASNKDLRTAINPENAGLNGGAAPSMEGDGLLMAVEAGAMTSRTAYLPLMSSIAGAQEGTIVNVNYDSFLHGLWLNAAGERFYNEESPYQDPNGNRAILRQYNASGKPVVLLLGKNPEVDALIEKQGLDWPTADSVEELAAIFELDPSAVRATVDRFNQMCIDGEDVDFGRPSESMIALEPPFYAATIQSSTSVTLGGVKIDPEARVVKFKSALDDGDARQPIAGLYAAGEVCEWNCANGWTVLTAMTTGRIAGKNVAAEMVDAS